MAGSAVRALAAHPGYAATNLQSHTGNWVSTAMMKVGNRLMAQSDADGALPTLFAATQDVPGGTYIGPRGPGELRGPPAVVSRSAAASDRHAAAALWAASERLTMTTWPEDDLRRA
jgi:hypothetical protein